MLAAAEESQRKYLELTHKMVAPKPYTHIPTPYTLHPTLYPLVVLTSFSS